MKKHALAMAFSLPENYRRKDFLTFHSRDAQEVAEKATTRGFSKGLLWEGYPACLSVSFRKDGGSARLRVDGTPSGEGGARFQATVKRMLGLDQPVELFETAYRNHPLLGPLVTINTGLRVPQTATPFEALTWAVIGQQVSVHAAVSIRRRFLLACGIRHSGGLLCFPDAGRVATMDEDLLCNSGFSHTKAASLLELARAVESGDVPLDGWMEQLGRGAIEASAIRERLSRIRGIGPWTVSYGLLRGFGHLDGSLHGDVAVRRNLARLLKSEDKISEKQAEAWLAAFSPWRALVGAHLWAMQSIAGY